MQERACGRHIWNPPNFGTRICRIACCGGFDGAARSLHARADVIKVRTLRHKKKGPLYPDFLLHID